jgi:hypothetical protein
MREQLVAQQHESSITVQLLTADILLKRKSESAQDWFKGLFTIGHQSSHCRSALWAVAATNAVIFEHGAAAPEAFGFPWCGGLPNRRH